MVKRLNANVDDAVYRLLRIALAEDGQDFAPWLRERIETYLVEKGKLPKPTAGRKSKREA